VTEPPKKLNTPTLETARLILRPPRMADAPAVQKRFGRWEIVKHLNAVVPWPYPDDGAEQHLRRLIAKVEAGESCAWMICLRDDPNDAIGIIELRSHEAAGRDMRGFWLAQEYWGRGLMTEAADRVVDFAFRDLDWRQIWVTNAVDNTRSSAVKQRQGATLVEIVTGNFVAGELPKEVWRIDADEWLAR
jgi:RimJ/RimL family protein N-acetyltransferase